jgi:hypothetical protein
MNDLGKGLIAVGVLFVLAGGALLLVSRMGLPLGRLPGDISYRGKTFTFFAPLGTSILVSVLLSAIFYLFSRFRR